MREGKLSLGHSVTLVAGKTMAALFPACCSASPKGPSQDGTARHSVSVVRCARACGAGRGLARPRAGWKHTEDARRVSRTVRS